MSANELTPYQQRAMETISARHRDNPSAAIDKILRRADVSRRSYDDALEHLRAQARIALHFHPERLSRNGKSVTEGLLESGSYTSQFETGLSSGSPSAHPGGERDIWEERLFGGAYHGPNVTAAGRPKYGALDIMGHPDGPSPRFGSCYFLLKPGMAKRATFTFGGSQEDNASERTATLDALDIVFATLFAELEDGHGAFGVEGLSIADCLAQIGKPFADPKGRTLGRALDSFIEVQVHGDICLDADMERIVADPAFHDHPAGETLAALSRKYAIPLDWHPGYVLSASEVPDVFRDYPVRPLAKRIVEDGLLDAATIGAAANSVISEPDTWKDWASPDDILTQFRRLWHVLVLKGYPRSR